MAVIQTFDLRESGGYHQVLARNDLLMGIDAVQQQGERHVSTGA